MFHSIIRVGRGVYRGGFGSSLLPSGLRGGIKSPPEDFLKNNAGKIAKIIYRNQYQTGKSQMKQLLKSEYVIFIQKQDSYQWGIQRGAEDVPPPPNYNSIKV